MTQFVNPDLIHGVDISSYDGDVEWNTLAKTKNFAFIRVSHGTLPDTAFQTNWAGAKSSGMIRGPYHYFRPDQDAQQQLTNFINAVGRLELGDLAPVIDVEEPSLWNKIAQKDRVGLIVNWLEGVERAFGIVPYVYLSPSFITDVLGVENVQPLAKYKLWIANYNVRQPTIPQPWRAWSFRQYDAKGVVAGIPNDNNCDLDVFFGTKDQLAAEGTQSAHVLYQDQAAQRVGESFAVQGCDISSYQEDVDWSKVATTKKFAFIRVSHGTATKDEKFQQNWRLAKENGVIRGAYHYFRPDEDFQEQVDFFISSIGRLEIGDLPPVLDLEEPERWKGIAQKDRVPLILRFLDALERAFGVVPFVYTSASFITQVIGVQNAKPLARYRLWVANYRVQQPRIPAPWTDWLIWQYSDKGRTPGVVTGDCDLDAFNGSLDELKALTVQTLYERSSGKAHGNRHRHHHCHHAHRCHCHCHCQCH